MKTYKVFVKYGVVDVFWDEDGYTTGHDEVWIRTTTIEGTPQQIMDWLKVIKLEAEDMCNEYDVCYYKPYLKACEAQYAQYI